MGLSEIQLRDQLLAMWMRLLGVEAIDPEDDFFSLGGDSLQLIEMVARLSREYGVDFDYDPFFEEPKISTLVRILRKEVT